MTKFITGPELEKAVCDIIWDAKDILLIVSPFIKLDTYFYKHFKTHENTPHLHMVIVFGKNEGNASRSMGKDDFDFFKNFPNVSIIYVPNLHAKYYGNESVGVITSINLYDYSFKNNIEFGVYTESGLLDNLKQSTSTDKQAWATALDVAKSGQAVFIKRPVYQKKLLSILTGGKNYISSEVLYDLTDSFYAGAPSKLPGSKKMGDFLPELDFETQRNERPTRPEFEKTKIVKPVEMGFCIRTGKQIPFNPERPYSYDAYQTWAQFGNVDYKEKYCHKTGQPSNGRTSMRNPVL